MHNNKNNKVQLIAIDVDGTLTDGGIYYTENGEEFKKFSVKDGLGINLAHDAGIEILVITGRKSQIVSRRMRELKVDYIVQGVENKAKFLENFLKEKSISPKNVCYIGDDLNDLDAMKLCFFKCCPADAVDEVKLVVDFISCKNGGYGAVRECIEWLIKVAMR